MTTTRLTTTIRFATATALVAAALLLPLAGAAHAAAPPARVIPAPDGCAPATTTVPDLDDFIAKRKAAWAADRVARHLF